MLVLGIPFVQNGILVFIDFNHFKCSSIVWRFFVRCLKRLLDKASLFKDRHCSVCRITILVSFLGKTVCVLQYDTQTVQYMVTSVLLYRTTWYNVVRRYVIGCSVVGVCIPTVHSTIVLVQGM